MNTGWRMLALVLLGSLPVLAADWQPARGPLLTRWAKDVAPDRVHPEYPRPQMVRPQWQSLNGLWDYAICPRTSGRPAEFDGQILVPFPIESALSGVMKRVDEHQQLWYRRAFELPEAWSGKRILLHFGAADWETTVWVNGHELGTHRGGYDPFTFDITGALRPTGPQELVVAVWDPTDAGTQPRGKQVRAPRGIWYTPTTGLWQTVWLEPVPQPRESAPELSRLAPEYIESLRIVPDVDAGVVRVRATVVSPAECQDGARTGGAIEVVVFDGEREIGRTVARPGEEAAVAIPDARLWSPDDPFLYGLRVSLFADAFRRARVYPDSVESYFGLRKIAVGQDDRGITRLLLNNRPIFQFGLLDQGFWPDGLYTAPTDAALRYDIELTRRLGFNLARKHVKIEPQRWYYWCDRLGLLVWQDMPSGDASAAPGHADIPRTPESAAQFELELRRMIDSHFNHPSIVMWVPFNEGWGQYDTKRIVERIKSWDPTRLVNCASGWNDAGVGDVHDIHAYPGPAAPQPEPDRAAVLGEFGGLGLPVAGHTWQAEANWGYRQYNSPEELTDACLNLITNLRPLIRDPGLSAAVYTQTTDVEIEVNGLMTYDRAQIKMDETRITAAHRRVYLPPPKITPVLPTAEQESFVWRYVTAKPADGWHQPGFDDRAWTAGAAGFGRVGTPGAVVRTNWETADIWLRRQFELRTLPTEPHLRVYHDEDCQVFINGTLIAELAGYTTHYVLAPLKDPRILRQGTNLIAVHCHQTGGGQGIDVGIVEIGESTER